MKDVHIGFGDAWLAPTFKYRTSVKQSMHVRLPYLLVALVLVSTAVLAIVQVNSNPAAKYMTPDGRIVVPAGQLTPELRHLLFSPAPKAPMSYMTFDVQPSAYPTLQVVGRTVNVPKAEKVAAPAASIRVPDFVGMFRQAIDQAIRGFLGLFTMNGAAADRYLVLDDAGCTPATMTTDAGCWAAVSGGAGGAGLPGAGDDAFADAASTTVGAGGVQDAAEDVLSLTMLGFTGTWDTGGFALTVGTGGVDFDGSFLANASTITVDGDCVQEGTVSFDQGTSAVIITGNGDLSGLYYSLTINVGVTTAMIDQVDIDSGTLTVNGTLGGDSVRIYSTGTPLIIGGLGDVTGLDVIFFDAYGNTLDVPGMTCNTLIISPTNAGIVHDTTITGDIVVNTGVTIAEDDGGLGSTVNFSTFDLTAQTLQITFSSADNPGTGVIFTTGAMTLSGDVTIDDPDNYIQLGSGSHDVAGNWTNASTSASWDAGTGTITFTSVIGGTMTFGDLGEAEFFNVTFTSSAGTAQTFTMSTNQLRWLSTLSIADAASTTELSTAAISPVLGAAVDSPDLSVGDGGILTANASAAFLESVTMTGGASGIITLTTAAWAVSGNWDTSGAGSVFTKGTSTVTMSGAAKTVNLLSSVNGFYNLIVSGTVAANSFVWASNLLTVSGTLTKTGQSLVFNALTNTAGAIVDGAVTVTGFSVANSGVALTTLASFAAWTLPSTFAWTDTVAAGTDTFTISGLQVGHAFTITKNGAFFATGQVNGSGQAIFTMASGDPAVAVSVSAVGGGGGGPPYPPTPTPTQPPTQAPEPLFATDLASMVAYPLAAVRTLMIISVLGIALGLLLRMHRLTMWSLVALAVLALVYGIAAGVLFVTGAF